MFSQASVIKLFSNKLEHLSLPNILSQTNSYKTFCFVTEATQNKLERFVLDNMFRQVI
jgi:hypothetical protein